MNCWGNDGERRERIGELGRKRSGKAGLTQRDADQARGDYGKREMV